MNVNDSEKVAGLLRSRGHEPAETRRGADFVFVNTCAVREKAAAKLYHALGAAAEAEEARGPSCGSASAAASPSSRAPRSSTRATHVDVLVGHAHLRPRARSPRRSRATARAARRPRPQGRRLRRPRRARRPPSPVRAYVTAMEGCNHVCSFCVVPRTRGPEVNRPVEAIVAEVESLVARGYPEVMLLGQTVNAYRLGDDRLRRPARARARGRRPAAAALHDLAPRARRRAPGATPCATSDRLCPYLHLPVPVGLRPHPRLDAARLHRARVPGRRSRCCATTCRDLALSTDVIVGYPGETEAEFEETLQRPRDGRLRRPVRVRLLAPAGHDRPAARGRRAGGREAAAAAGPERPPAAVAAAAERRPRWGRDRGGPRRSRRRRRPRVGPHAALPDRPPRGDASPRRPHGARSRSPPPAPTRSRAGYRKSFIDREFRAPYILARGGGGAHADRDDHQGADDRPHHQHADHRPARRGRASASCPSGSASSRPTPSRSRSRTSRRPDR